MAKQTRLIVSAINGDFDPDERFYNVTIDGEDVETQEHRTVVLTLDENCCLGLKETCTEAYNEAYGPWQ
jgi:hypothetical protein